VKRRIHIYGDEVLRAKAQPVAEVNRRIRALAADMIEVMRAEKGVGLAAEQVGETLALCVLGVPPEYDRDETGARINPGVDMPAVLINPEILERSKEAEVADEGCLSFPGIYVPVARSVEIRLRYTDLDGRSQTRTFRKFVARVAQHEIDHLNGVLLVDRMSPLKRIALSGQLKRMKQETRERLGSVAGDG
jgi:peptide deformylase